MGKRREGRYSARLYVGLQADTAGRIREASDRYGLAESVIVRRAVELGLTRALDAIRKEEEGRGGEGG